MLKIATKGRGQGVLSFHDVGDWSRAQSRPNWLQFVTCCLEMFECFDAGAFDASWSKLVAGVNECGLERDGLLDDSGVKGFAGTLDSRVQRWMNRSCKYAARLDRCLSIPSLPPHVHWGVSHIVSSPEVRTLFC